MEKYWKSKRDIIRQRPMPKLLSLQTVKGLMKSKYGKYLVLTCMETNEFPDTIEDNKMYKGELLDWKLANGKTVVAFLKGSELQLDLSMNIYCNDCQNKSITDYHFDGIECKNCGSFNTQS